MKRRTSQRRAILQALEEAPGPLTPHEVLEHAGHGRLGLATVYRNLNALTKRTARWWRCICLTTAPALNPRGAVIIIIFAVHAARACLNLRPPARWRGSRGSRCPAVFLVKDHELILYGLCPTCGSAESAS